MPDPRHLLPRSELRFAARLLLRTPSFAAAVVLVLALGIGAATAVFSLVNGVLLEPLPYPQSSRLVRLTHTVSNAGLATVDQSDATVLLYQSQARASRRISSTCWASAPHSAERSPRARTGPGRMASSCYRTASGGSAFTAAPTRSVDRSS